MFSTRKIKRIYSEQASDTEGGSSTANLETLKLLIVKVHVIRVLASLGGSLDLNFRLLLRASSPFTQEEAAFTSTT